MKIEIGESLVYSYLKHIEGCRVVQTNWKTSGNWVVTDFEQERAKELHHKVATSPYFHGIFKNSSLKQLIRQAEIDVLGINTAENTIYGIDVAFHTSGLNYGSKEETALRIIKKIFRTVFIMQSYFNEYEKFNSYFITPKTHYANQVVIDDLILRAKELIEDENITIDFISNDDFYENIVDPLIKNTNNESDTMELFSRSVKLLQLDNRVKPENSIAPKTIKIKNHVDSDKRMVANMLIGQFVQYCFKDAYNKGFITSGEIHNLQDPTYSKSNFNLNHEVLRNQSRATDDHLGRSRYYKRTVYCGHYRLCSQWVEPQWDVLLKWLYKIGYDYKTEIKI